MPYVIFIDNPRTGAPLPATIAGRVVLQLSLPPNPPPPPAPAPAPQVFVSIHDHRSGQSVATIAATFAANGNDWTAVVPNNIAAGTYFVVAIYQSGAEFASTASMYVSK